MWRIKKFLDKINIWIWKVKFTLSKKNTNIDSSDISIIVVGRNDNYGGDFSLRLKTTLDWNLKQLPNAELIYVEWNKIENKESDCIWIEKSYKNAKCYIVNNEIHASINQNPKMPVMEYFAKNLGMKKATKDWILMINADCFVSNEVVKNMKKLNHRYVYGTNYISIKWDEKPIEDYHLKNNKNVVVSFAAPKNLSAVVGNFVFTHSANWMKATGYDEQLTNVRAGVDANGLYQLLNLGLKPMVLGSHYHLDHPESIIHGNNATHGNHQFDNIPYKNKENWGFSNNPLKQTSERIWQLEKI